MADRSRSAIAGRLAFQCRAIGPSSPRAERSMSVWECSPASPSSGSFSTITNTGGITGGDFTAGHLRWSATTTSSSTAARSPSGMRSAGISVSTRLDHQPDRQYRYHQRRRQRCRHQREQWRQRLQLRHHQRREPVSPRSSSATAARTTLTLGPGSIINGLVLACRHRHVPARRHRQGHVQSQPDRPLASNMTGSRPSTRSTARPGP